jgi:carbamoyl-phosphate synthase small subunit
LRKTRELSENLEENALLVLEDGTSFTGTAIGKIGTTAGEICFNTGMTGYQEVFTDPSYFGQILVMTSDHIGNYGVSQEDVESGGIKIAGLVCKKFSEKYSRNQAVSSLNDYLIDNHLVGIADIDTRALVRTIRDKGAMNAMISSEILDRDELLKKLKDVPSMDGLELASKVWEKETSESGDPNSDVKVAVLDLGSKRNIVRCLNERGVYTKTFPGDTDFETMESWKPDGYMISNGPGDPAAMPYAVKTIQSIIDANKPVFGICLGCQTMALAVGLSTYKMHHGHRGANHPVQNLITGKSEITTQNHGFAIDKDSVTDEVEVTHIHLNDETVAGIRVKGKPAFAVQYHPEASPGPHDSRYLFDQFVEEIKQNQ